jgi:cyanate permease
MAMKKPRRAGKVKYALLGWLIGLPLPIVLLLLFGSKQIPHRARTLAQFDDVVGYVLAPVFAGGGVLGCREQAHGRRFGNCSRRR